MIRVLIIDDSAFMRQKLTEILQSDPEFEIVGKAGDGLDGLRMAKELRPDLITLDLEMPVMDGMRVLPRLLMEAPCRIVIIGAPTTHSTDVMLECLNLGAVDAIPKPSGEVSLDLGNYSSALLERLRTAAHARRPTRRFRANRRPARVEPEVGAPAQLIIAIGASTGGPKAVSEVVSRLPPSLPVAIVVVQHMPPSFTSSFAQRLGNAGPYPFSESRPGVTLLSGHGYVAAGGSHLVISPKPDGGWLFRTVTQPIDHLHKPSVDVFFHSCAQHAGKNAVAALLTGMGDDGAAGLKAIRDAAGSTVAEDESTCVVFGMPARAIELGGAEAVVPLPNIANYLARCVLERVNKRSAM
jgi:two-component system chemotaxis response regulator CheB